MDKKSFLILEVDEDCSRLFGRGIKVRAIEVNGGLLRLVVSIDKHCRSEFTVASISEQLEEAKE